jgi:hypothetical protein
VRKGNERAAVMFCHNHCNVDWNLGSSSSRVALTGSVTGETEALEGGGVDCITVKRDCNLHSLLIRDATSLTPLSTLDLMSHPICTQTSSQSSIPVLSPYITLNFIIIQSHHPYASPYLSARQQCSSQGTLSQ